ncbi:hypothetical protein DH2020_026326 [Rehmannia glutinosa]|uniref:CRIB domain-containing protein n=1 Tax=Rehmannia glutinosa TaxID=99300 RepID=A0ABR0W0A2_REHGL
MTEILRSPPSPSCKTPTNNDGSFINSINPAILYRRNCRNTQIGEGDDEVSVLAILVTIFRKSLVGCGNTSGFELEEQLMEIGLPTNVRHVAHVTFDRFNGFLGLPVEFEPEVPRRPPSASTRVFGVSTESMQLSFDSRGNCVPTILLMMQRRVCIRKEACSLKESSELIRKWARRAWFRELPRGVLDSLSPEQVMQAQSEDECTQLVRLLPPTEAALLDWAINLMADVAQLEHLNKMNEMLPCFPLITHAICFSVQILINCRLLQMSDPLTALMYAVQVMNFLKTLIVKTLRQREDSTIESGPGPTTRFDPSNEDHHHSNLKPINTEARDQAAEEQQSHQEEPKTGISETHGSLSSIENIFQDGKGHVADILNSRAL